MRYQTGVNAMLYTPLTVSLTL